MNLDKINEIYARLRDLDQTPRVIAFVILFVVLAIAGGALGWAFGFIIPGLTYLFNIVFWVIIAYSFYQMFLFKP